jgi:hypothetical protein
VATANACAVPYAGERRALGGQHQVRLTAAHQDRYQGEHAQTQRDRHPCPVSPSFVYQVIIRMPGHHFNGFDWNAMSSLQQQAFDVPINLETTEVKLEGECEPNVPRIYSVCFTVRAEATTQVQEPALCKYELRAGGTECKDWLLLMGWLRFGRQWSGTSSSRSVGN